MRILIYDERKRKLTKNSSLSRYASKGKAAPKTRSASEEARKE